MDEFKDKLYKRLKEEYKDKLHIQKPLWNAEYLNELEKTKFVGNYEIAYVTNVTNNTNSDSNVEIVKNLPSSFLMQDYKRYTLINNDPLAEYDEIKAKQTIKIIIENGEIVDDTNTPS